MQKRLIYWFVILLLSTATPMCVLQNPSLQINKPAHGTLLGAGLECGSSGNLCSISFEEKTQINLVANPDPGYILEAWQGALGRQCDASNTNCTITLSRPLQSSALFARIPDPGGGVQVRAGRPNIIVIMADDMGYGDISAYGSNSIKTPNIDRIAAEGMLFTDAHANAAVCSPTRYGILTGRYAWRTWLKRWVVSPLQPALINPSRLTLPALLEQHGYATGAFGKWHLGFGDNLVMDWNNRLVPGPLEVGFGTYFGVPTSHNWPPYVYVENHNVYQKQPGESIWVGVFGNQYFEFRGIAAKRIDEEVDIQHTRRAMDFIEKNKDRPFFLYLPTAAIHGPITPQANVLGLSQAGLYGDYVLQFDWVVGQIIDQLDRLGLSNDTLLFVTSDNGAIQSAVTDPNHRANGPLRGGKGQIYEGGHRVPFIARWPGKIPAASSSDALVSMTDLFATAAQILNHPLEHNTGEDSISLLPTLLQTPTSQPIRTDIIHHSGMGMFSIRQGQWKLILGLGSGLEINIVNPPGQLYDLKADIGERINLYSHNPDLVSQLSALLNRHKNAGRSRFESN